MPLINKYQTDSVIDPEDRLLGSDIDGRKSTRQYRIGDLIDFIASSTNTDGLGYRYSTGAVNKNTAGTFQSDTDVLRNISKIYLNVTTKDGINADALFKVLKDDTTPIYFKVADTKDPSKIAYFNIVSIEKSAENAYYLFNVAIMNTLGYGKAVDGRDYYFTLDVFSEYDVPTKTSEIENDGADGENPFITLKDIYRGNAVIDYGFYKLPGDNYDYFVWASLYIINNVVYNEYISDTVTLNDGDTEFNRTDWIAINNDETFSVVEGTPAESYGPPELDNETQVGLTFITVEANSTSPSNVENILMYDENLQQAGDEYDTYRSTTRITLDSTEQKVSGTKSIKFASVIDGDRIELSSTVGFERDDVDVLVFSILSETNQKINIYFDPPITTGAEQVPATLTLKHGKYGFDQTVTTWQTITIPTSAFNFPSGVIKKLTFRNSFNAVTTFYLDNIFLQKTGGSGGSTGEFLRASLNLNDVADKAESRNNLNVYSKPEVDALMADKEYDDVDDLLANQTEQTETQRIVVIDASADINITFPVGETKLQAYYQYLGTPNGLISDYRLVSAPYGNKLDTKPLVTADTATVITLYPFGNFCNSYAPNLEDTAFTFALTDSDNPAGEWAVTLIKTSGVAVDFPTLTDAEYVEGAPFAVDSYYDLHAWHNGATVAYTFLSRSAPPAEPDWVIIPEILGDLSIRDWQSSGGLSSLGYGSITIPDNTSGNGRFGLIEDFDVDFTKWSFEFKLMYLQSGSLIAFNTTNTGTGTLINLNPYINSSRIFFIQDDSNVTQATTSALTYGDIVRTTFENGKVEIFVNGISVDSWIDVSIVWTKVISSFTGYGKGFTAIDIKQIIHRS